MAGVVGKKIVIAFGIAIAGPVVNDAVAEIHIQSVLIEIAAVFQHIGLLRINLLPSCGFDAVSVLSIGYCGQLAFAFYVNSRLPSDQSGAR